MRRRDRPRVQGDVRAARWFVWRNLEGVFRTSLWITVGAVVLGAVVLLVRFGLPTKWPDQLAPHAQVLSSGSAAVGPAGGILAALAGAFLFVGGVLGPFPEVLHAGGVYVRSWPSRRELVAAAHVLRLWWALCHLGVCIAVAACATSAVAGNSGPALVLLVLAAAGLPIFLTVYALARLARLSIFFVRNRFYPSSWARAIAYPVVLVGVYGSLVVLYLLVTSAETASDGPYPEAFLPGEPLQAYASLALAPLGATPRSAGLRIASGALVASLLLFGLVGLIETRLLRSPDEDPSVRAIGGSKPTQRVPQPFAWAPAGRVAWRYFLRTGRDARLLAHLTPLLVITVIVIGLGCLLGVVPPVVVGPAGVIGAPVIAGAAYCLNPLGDERQQHSFQYTSARTARVLLRGRALAGGTLGAAWATAILVPLGVAAGDVSWTLTTVALSVLLALLAPGIALGIGTALPGLEDRKYMGIEWTYPSTMAMSGYVVCCLVVGLAGLALVEYTLDGTLPLRVAVRYWGVYLAVVGVPALGGYLYAVWRYRRFSLDQR